MNDENRTQPKKAWQKPELIVLLRRKPEEAVLVYCKTSAAAGPNAEGCQAGGCEEVYTT